MLGAMDFSLIRHIGTGFLVFAALLLSAPLVLVAKRLRPWRSVVGLWVAGWGFLLIGAGTRWAELGWSGLVVPGVIVTTAGHLLQSRSAKPR